jgi:uncharacterized protein YlxW (UPF0749 family)
MCSFVGNFIDINKMTDEQKKRLEEFLNNRKAELRKQIDELQARAGEKQAQIDDCDNAAKRLPRP